MKSEVLADFICFDNQEIIITANKAVATSDLNNINSNNIMSSCLSQSKSYLKILGISYYLANTNSPITSNIVEEMIKNTHVFNDVILVSHPCIIKAFPKSNMSII